MSMNDDNQILDCDKYSNETIDWENVDWVNIIPRLLLYTRKRLGADIVVDAQDINDIVQSAIEKTLSGKRKYIPKGQRHDLYYHLACTIRSDLGHRFKSKSHSTKDQNRDVESEVDPKTSAHLPEFILLDDETKQLFIDHLKQRNKNLAPIFHDLLAGYKPREIAIKNDVDVAHIYEKIRVIKREALSFLEGDVL